ncbi:unnamed protein product [Moneuplotes crassus]|uniref:Uncharacterized protein n=2 Tax=Euplotes crassus TaxID=5936 RepID=A0AAD1XFF1_EUPCR|nr:unnamed protein product [Moneuplotes crassus]
MESSIVPPQTDNSHAVKEEKLIFKEINEIARMLANNLHFNSFGADMENEEEDSFSDSGSDEDIGTEYESLNLELDFYYPDEINFLKKKLFVDSFDFKRLALQGVKRQNHLIANFLNSSFPKSIKSFRMGAKEKLCVPISNYFNQITRIGCKVHKEIFLVGFQMSLPQLKRFITSFKQTGELYFRLCEFGITAIPDFSTCLEGTTIQRFDFIETRFTNHPDPEPNQEGFKNLIQGLTSSPSFLLSFKELDIRYSQIPHKHLKKILSQHHLAHIYLI